jgi:hypothetical protein
MQPSFSASQTAWRRDRDSNPRYSFVQSHKPQIILALAGFCLLNVNERETEPALDEASNKSGFVASLLAKVGDDQYQTDDIELARASEEFAKRLLTCRAV